MVVITRWRHVARGSVRPLAQLQCSASSRWVAVRSGERMCRISAWPLSAVRYQTTWTAATIERQVVPKRRKALLESVASDLHALQELYDSLSGDSSRLHQSLDAVAERLVLCHAQRRRIFVTGIGKSGIVAQRLASTLSSMSVRSQWIHASEWVHGELGLLESDDVVVIFSHSGNTSELLALPALVRARGCTVVAILGSEHSALAADSDLVVVAPASDLPRCPVPSRSIIVQDAVSNALVEYFVTSVPDRPSAFQQNHPGGSIGDRFSSDSSR